MIQAVYKFSTEECALFTLDLHGFRESRNGVIRGEWSKMNPQCRAAMNYLCDEWDFVFEEPN